MIDRRKGPPTSRAVRSFALGALVAGAQCVFAAPVVAASAAVAVKLPGGDHGAYRREEAVFERLEAATPKRDEADHRPRVRPALSASESGLRANAPRALYISSPFGWRHDPFLGNGRSHEGIDLPGRFGAPVHATGAGVVTYASWMNGYGYLVQIDHADGFRTRYGHLSRILVRGGERVGLGEVIGQVGSTGRSTGSHLHYEIRRSGQPVNPLAYIGHAVASEGGRYDERLDMIQLGSASTARAPNGRSAGWSNSVDGLPRAIIR